MIKVYATIQPCEWTIRIRSITVAVLLVGHLRLVGEGGYNRTATVMERIYYQMAEVMQFIKQQQSTKKPLIRGLKVNIIF